MRSRNFPGVSLGLALGFLLFPVFSFGQDWQARALRLPQPDSCRAYLHRLTEEPHVAGTEEDFQNVMYIKNTLARFGFDVRIESFDVYLPYPQEVSLEVITPEPFSGPTPEQGFPLDKDSYATNVMLGWNAYSPSGEARGQVVYVNYGRPEDYDRLAELGVEVRGKIVLVRYGKVFRGVKSRVAEEHGAEGVLIYSDPADDGYMKGDVYPNGPYRPEFGVQRGSIEYMFIYPGDPLTPGVPATNTAKRIDPGEAANLPAIPTLPISYGDARRILKALAGPNVPSGWQGGLPFAYHVGPGPAEVQLHVEMDYQVRPIWNVIATLRGSEFPDQWVVLGNHHDAWTYGAVDPSSGTAAVLETARVFGELAKQGYRPRRSLVFAFWDGEEYGLLGSTEWVEARREFLKNNCVAYLNIDVAVGGPNFGASATPALKPFIQKVLARVEDPKSRRPLLEEVWRRQNKKKKRVPENLLQSDSLMIRLGNLGSGSDYTAFFDFAGVPSLSMGFGGRYGVYHAIYDDFYWMSHFGDPEFLYHAAMARVAATMLLELADADLIPFDVAQYAREMTSHAEKIEKRLREKEAPQEVSLKRLIEKCRDWQRAAQPLHNFSSPPAEINLAVVNENLMEIERLFLDEKGLPDRPWFKHQLFAPGFYTGYASKPFPAIQYYLDRKDWDRLAAAIQQAEALIQRAAEHTRSLVQLLGIPESQN